jgi:hypothetical protein
MSISPSLWGPSTWKALHYITFAYPNNPTEDDKINYSNFFNSIGNVLACKKCRINFKMHLKKFPLDNNALASNYSLVNWLINIHNEVNKMHNKKILTYDEVLKIYMSYNPTNTICNKRILLLILLIAILVIGYKKSKSRN